MKTNHQRASHRIGLSMEALVSDLTRSNRVVCTICDASKHGCRIKSGDISALPDDIFVEVKSMKSPIRGTIVWRKDGMAGVNFNWDASRADDRRDDLRYETVMRATVRGADQSESLSCIVQNASGSGCLIVCNEADSLCGDVFVRLDSKEEPIAGRIAWRKGNMVGVQFDEAPPASAAEDVEAKTIMAEAAVVDDEEDDDKFFI